MKTIADCPLCGPYIAHPGQTHSCSEWRRGPADRARVVRWSRGALLLAAVIIVVSALTLAGAR